MLFLSTLQTFVKPFPTLPGAFVALAIATSGGALGAAIDAPPQSLAQPQEFDSCSQRQRTDLQQLLSQARLELEQLTIELDASYADAVAYGAPRFERWFGTFEPERFARVRETYLGVLGAMQTESVRFDCACEAYPDGRYNAYVYQAQHYDIYLCPGYWQLGAQLQRAVLVHEFTHFSVLGHTSDFAYGHYDAAQLALDSPQQAIRNADSYELFFMNVPDVALAADRATQPSATPTVLSLATGASHDGEIGRRQTALYGVSGAGLVMLQPNNGADVDLHVYQGRERVCVSNRSSAASERCDLDPSLSYSAHVVPFANDLAEQYQYTIQALQAPPNAADDAPGDAAATVDQSGGGSLPGSLVLLLCLCRRARRAGAG